MIIASDSTVLGQHRCGGRPSHWGLGTDLLPLAERVRWPSRRPGPAPEAAGDREQPAQGGGGRTDPEQPDFQEARALATGHQGFLECRFPCEERFLTVDEVAAAVLSVLLRPDVCPIDSRQPPRKVGSVPYLDPWRQDSTRWKRGGVAGSSLTAWAAWCRRTALPPGLGWLASASPPVPAVWLIPPRWSGCVPG